MDLSRGLAVSGHDFSLAHYREILRKAMDLGYRLPLVREVASGLPEYKFFLIRHDVDVTPWAALTMAQLEVEEGVRTSYYFRLHAAYYNLMNAEVVALVKEIAELGHEVGLHYEPGYFSKFGQDPVEGTLRDIRIFEELIDMRTSTISQHQPSRGPLFDQISPDHPCAYQSALVREIPYFGDSGFTWREGCVCTKLGVHERLHTLVHPHSWVISGRPWQAVLRQHAKDQAAWVGRAMESYIVELEEYLANRERLDQEREARYRESR
jgi:hypothetical protein